MAQQLDYPIEILRQAEGWNLEKSFEGKFFGEYVACVGATAAPLGFKADNEKGKGGKTGDTKSKGKVNGILIAAAVFAFGILGAVILSLASAITYVAAKAENRALQEQMAGLQEIKPIYDNYVSTKTAYDRLTAMHDATRNRNDDLYEFMEELERKMPSNGVITSFTSDAETVTINMSVSSKTEAASMIEQFRTFDSLLPDTVSVSSITADVDGEDTVLSYNFTIVGSYRDMDEAPEEEMTDEEAMQQNLEDTENHEVAKAQ